MSNKFQSLGQEAIQKSTELAKHCENKDADILSSKLFGLIQELATTDKLMSGIHQLSSFKANLLWSSGKENFTAQSANHSENIVFGKN